MGPDFQQSFRHLYMDDENDDNSINNNANTIDFLLGFMLVLSTFFSLAYVTLRGTQKLSNFFKTQQYMVDLGLQTARVQNPRSPTD